MCSAGRGLQLGGLQRRLSPNVGCLAHHLNLSPPAAPHPPQTTYNALISAYGKAGQLDKVMEVFQVRPGGRA